MSLYIPIKVHHESTTRSVVEFLSFPIQNQKVCAISREHQKVSFSQRKRQQYFSSRKRTLGIPVDIRCEGNGLFQHAGKQLLWIGTSSVLVDTKLLKLLICPIKTKYIFINVFEALYLLIVDLHDMRCTLGYLLFVFGGCLPA